MNHAFPICAASTQLNCFWDPGIAIFGQNLWLPSFKYEICCYFYDYLYIDAMVGHKYISLHFAGPVEHFEMKLGQAYVLNVHNLPPW
jgi:hypothetical protein